MEILARVRGKQLHRGVFFGYGGFTENWREKQNARLIYQGAFAMHNQLQSAKFSCGFACPPRLWQAGMNLTKHDYWCLYCSKCYCGCPDFVGLANKKPLVGEGLDLY